MKGGRGWSSGHQELGHPPTPRPSRFYPRLSPPGLEPLAFFRMLSILFRPSNWVAAMHRGGIEELKRAEKEAAIRVLDASRAEPYDPARYKMAQIEWQSARIALLSAGVRVRELPTASQPSTRRGGKKVPPKE